MSAINVRVVVPLTNASRLMAVNVACGWLSMAAFRALPGPGERAWLAEGGLLTSLVKEGGRLASCKLELRKAVRLGKRAWVDQDIKIG